MISSIETVEKKKIFLERRSWQKKKSLTVFSFLEDVLNLWKEDWSKKENREKNVIGSGGDSRNYWLIFCERVNIYNLISG